MLLASLLPQILIDYRLSPPPLRFIFFAASAAAADDAAAAALRCYTPLLLFTMPPRLLMPYIAIADAATMRFDDAVAAHASLD